MRKTKQIMPWPATQPKLTVVEITRPTLYVQSRETIELTNIGRPWDTILTLMTQDNIIEVNSMSEDCVRQNRACHGQLVQLPNLS